MRSKKRATKKRFKLYFKWLPSLIIFRLFAGDKFVRTWMAKPRGCVPLQLISMFLAASQLPKLCHHTLCGCKFRDFSCRHSRVSQIRSFEPLTMAMHIRDSEEHRNHTNNLLNYQHFTWKCFWFTFEIILAVTKRKIRVFFILLNGKKK